jgi:hypothetical protein
MVGVLNRGEECTAPLKNLLVKNCGWKRYKLKREPKMRFEHVF